MKSVYYLFDLFLHSLMKMFNYGETAVGDFTVQPQRSDVTEILKMKKLNLEQELIVPFHRRGN